MIPAMPDIAKEPSRLGDRPGASAGVYPAEQGADLLGERQGEDDV